MLKANGAARGANCKVKEDGLTAQKSTGDTLVGKEQRVRCPGDTDWQQYV
jgi:hypothetical protein